jgi:hypothetical protein
MYANSVIFQQARSQRLDWNSCVKSENLGAAITINNIRRYQILLDK